MSNIIIATLGHIDHGKTTLIKKLTNKNLDTLPEEKKRNMTIDIGFTDLKLTNDTAGLIDVPGHEKFIKNMSAGVCGANFIILVIACDDGIMPQTVEHFEIASLLGIKNGIIVLTKKDMVSSKQYNKVFEEVQKYFKNTFLENKIYSIDDDIKNILNREIKNVKIKEGSHFKMNVDRVFNILGVGEIITGSTLSGMVKVGEIKTLYPQKKEVRIKNIQNHNKNVDSLGSHKRCAINISQEKASRGNVLADFMYVSRSFDIYFETKEMIKNNQRIRLNINANEVIGRVYLYEKNILKKGYAKIILEKDIPIYYNDIGVVRNYSPVKTLGKVIILNPNSTQKLRFDDNYIDMLKIFHQNIDDDLKLLEHRILYLCEYNKLDSENIKILLENKKIYPINGYMHEKELQKILCEIQEILDEFYKNNHLKMGIKKENLKYKNIEEILKYSDFIVKNNLVIDKNYKIKLTKDEKEIKEKIFKYYKNQRYDFKEMDLENTPLHTYMVEQEFIIYLGKNSYILNGYLKECKKVLTQFFNENNALSIPQFRKLLGLKRDCAIILLEYLDKIGFTKKNRESLRLYGGKND